MDSLANGFKHYLQILHMGPASSCVIFAQPSFFPLVCLHAVGTLFIYLFYDVTYPVWTYDVTYPVWTYVVTYPVST